MNTDETSHIIPIQDLTYKRRLSWHRSLQGAPLLDRFTEVLDIIVVGCGSMREKVRVKNEK